MKKITEHQNGTYTLNNLTFDELQIICSACVDLINEVNERESEGKKLNDYSKKSRKFADELSDEITDIMTK